ncbi:hypothetical protein SAMN04488515_3177 [Cognatiyoonia koreensis]|uniref:GDSL-like Lipase/Acylhydrolase family protein n=1 Tax=Cognatiyoonia koreensis TaxID=364200 RepID=A0A1I0RU28_9RHOB|nr:SGNH/GDSL hydrolase family protein [Cognatiyoonia koreensis]SEW44289.1 hypothetical protein SAMN04488515_3177 [Cognatiyoonia koreensis]
MSLVYRLTVAASFKLVTAALEIFKRWADDRKVDWVDLGHTPMTHELYRDEIHPNAQGADRIAGVLADVLGPRLQSCQ